MAKKAVGLIVMSVDGEDYACSDFGSTKATGKKPVPTMNRTGKIQHTASGIQTYQLRVSVVIPVGKDTVDWQNIEDARISVESPDGGFRETYIDCSTVDVSDSYNVNGETRRDLNMFCLDYLDETF
ncbi:hypothetical protein F892_03116 [Acinetobacter vivianii]|uniref:Phage tail protein n=1 Tax=Acinetobacter vivianii TaxID=1776742 RepID=N9NGU7_9GAMM|nr:hypothetical protein [Acinetobacter vivianii]ENX20193.1 hypothetical protein F892_03116 [Acinetobacter vivianii]GGI59359.1 hypothetical protein GCM10011446_08540 [Acinetobacter vivianii]